MVTNIPIKFFILKSLSKITTCLISNKFYIIKNLKYKKIAQIINKSSYIIRIKQDVIINYERIILCYINFNNYFFNNFVMEIN